MSPTAIPDPLTPLQDVAQAEALVTALVPAERVYTHELPATESSLMPRNAVVLSLNGGPRMAGYQALGRLRVETRSYAATTYTATEIDRALLATFKELSRHAVDGLALLHNLIVETGGIPRVDRELGDTHYVYRSYLMLASEEAVA